MKKNYFLIILTIFFACKNSKKTDNQSFNQKTDTTHVPLLKDSITKKDTISVTPDSIQAKLPELTKSKKTLLKGNYIGGEYKGNYIWGGAMNLAWNELNDNVLHDKLALATTDKIALEMVNSFNQPVFSKKDLDEKSYYIKSGYGQQTVDLINKESKKKFPNKSFQDLKLKLSPTDIISYAYFLKEVQYKTPFAEKKMYFEGKQVQSFAAINREQRQNIEVLQYESGEKFIIRLSLKQDDEQLILAKGFDMNDPNIVLATLKKTKNATFLENVDKFEAPVLHVSHQRVYQELLNKPLTNKGFEGYEIKKMFENIRFDMDAKGARAENEAVAVAGKMADVARPSPRYFILDKPFWVVMKRKNSQNPYFLLGVKNQQVMNVVK